MLTDEEIETHAKNLAEAACGHANAVRSIAEYTVLLSRAMGWNENETLQISLKALEMLKRGKGSA